MVFFSSLKVWSDKVTFRVVLGQLTTATDEGT